MLWRTLPALHAQLPAIAPPRTWVHLDMGEQGTLACQKSPLSVNQAPAPPD
jgi:hypothetical protein